MTTAIKLDPESLAVLVQKALIESIDEETREKILSDAIAQILLVPKDERPHYQRTEPLKSPLTRAFEQAIDTATHKVVREMIDSDPRVVEKIREIAGEVVNPLIDGTYDLSAVVGEAIGTALGAAWRDRRDMR